MAIITFSLMTSPSLVAGSAEVANQAIGAEGGRKVTNEALDAPLKIAKSKPSLSTSNGIVCLACIPATGAAASPALCIACGILLAKTFG